MISNVNITEENKELYKFLLNYFETRQLTRKQVKACYDNESTCFLTIHDVQGLISLLLDEKRLIDFKELTEKINILVKPRYFPGILSSILDSEKE